MAFEEVTIHDYLMNGIHCFFPKEYVKYCASIDEIFQDYIDLEHLKNEDFPSVKISSISFKEIFGKKDYFLIMPGLLRVVS